MNTIKRGKKNTDISRKVKDVWNDRLHKCLNEKGYTQKEFASEFKKRYKTGSQSDVNRWLRVGASYGKAGKEIGLPSYDTMRRIADFLGVTVGYLTGETDYESFDMERACNYLGINQTAAKAIIEITKGRPTSRFDQFLAKDRREALCYLMASDNFNGFIDALCDLAAVTYRQKNPFDHIEEACKKINPEILEQAKICSEYCLGENVEDEPESTPELRAAIAMLNEAKNKAFEQEIRLNNEIKGTKYDLSEKYFKLLDEVVSDDHLRAMTSCRLARVASLDELKKLVENRED